MTPLRYDVALAKRRESGHCPGDECRAVQCAKAVGQTWRLRLHRLPARRRVRIQNREQQLGNLFCIGRHPSTTGFNLRYLGCEQARGLPRLPRANLYSRGHTARPSAGRTPERTLARPGQTLHHSRHPYHRFPGAHPSPRSMGHRQAMTQYLLALPGLFWLVLVGW